MSDTGDNYDVVGSGESPPTNQRMTEHDQVVAAMQASLRFEQDQIEAAMRASLMLNEEQPEAPMPASMTAEEEQLQAAMQASMMPEEEQLQAAMRASLMPEDEELQAVMQASLVEYGNETVNDVVLEDATGQEAKKDPAPKLVENEELVAPAAVSQASVLMLDDLIAFNIGDEPENGARIQFRLPDGNRMIRKFDSSKSVKYVYAYVAQSIPEGKNGQSFVLKAGFPPKDLIGEIENSIQASALAGEAVSICWK